MDNISRDTLIIESYFGKRIQDLNMSEWDELQSILRQGIGNLSLDFSMKYLKHSPIQWVLGSGRFPARDILRVLGKDYDDVWEIIARYGDFRGIDLDFFREIKNELDLTTVFYKNKLPEEIVTDYYDEVPLFAVIYRQDLSDESFETMLNDKFSDPSNVYPGLNKDAPKLDINNFWDLITIHQTLGEGFIEKYSEFITWKDLRTNKDWSSSFIRRYKDKLPMEAVIRDCIVPEDLITEVLIERKLNVKGDYVKPLRMNIHQHYSDDFIDKNKHNIEWKMFSRNKFLTIEQLRKYEKCIHFDGLFDGKYDARFLDKAFIDFVTKYNDKPIFTIEGYDIDFIRDNKDLIDWEHVNISLAHRKDQDFVRFLIDINPSILDFPFLYDILDVPLDSIISHTNSTDIEDALLGSAVSYETKMEIVRIINFNSKF